MRPAGRSPAGTPLTEKELDVLLLIAIGETPKAVAATIDRSSHTVRARTVSIKNRTGTRSLASALAVVVARGEVHIAVELGEPLPKRHQQILIGLARDLSDEQIGRGAGMSLHTVKSETKRLTRALNAQSRTHLVYLGFKTGNLTINRREQNG